MQEIFLALEASTYAGSVALLTADGEVLAEHEVKMRGEKEERLMPAVAELLPARMIGELSGVICGAGPGSFTSLRIAAAIAKGVAHGAGVPLFAVSSLLLSVAAHRDVSEPGLYLSLLDAMRGDYHALLIRVDADGIIRGEGDVKILAEADAVALARESGAREVGPGRTLDYSPHARGVARMLRLIMATGAVDKFTWEPTYGRLAEAEVRLQASQSAERPR